MTPDRATVERKLVGVISHLGQHPHDLVQQRNKERLEARLKDSRYRQKEDGATLGSILANEVIQRAKP